MSNVIAIIQARTNSSRLPGKVLMEIAGKPIIHHVIDACRDFQTVVAVPKDDRDLIDCIGQKAKVIQGPENDVAARIGLAIVASRASWFLRICADSPMLTRDIVMRPAQVYYPNYEVVRTTGVHGLNVELVDGLAYLWALPMFNEYEREHVTSYFYDNPNFRVLDLHIKGHDPCVVDTQEDFDRVKAMMEA